MRSLAPITRPDDFAPRAKALEARLRPSPTPPAVLRKSRRLASFASDMEVPHFPGFCSSMGASANPSLLLGLAPPQTGGGRERRLLKPDAGSTDPGLARG